MFIKQPCERCHGNAYRKERVPSDNLMRNLYVVRNKAMAWNLPLKPARNDNRIAEEQSRLGLPFFRFDEGERKGVTRFRGESGQEFTGMSLTDVGLRRTWYSDHFDAKDRKCHGKITVLKTPNALHRR